MGEYAYRAKDPRGKIKSGRVQANTSDQAKAQLAKMRLKPLSIRATSAADDKGNGATEQILGNFIVKDDRGRIQVQLGDTKPTPKDLIIFTKQFATMIGSGVPLMQALGVLAEQQRVRAFGSVLERIRQAVENGSTLSQAMTSHPKIFDSLYVAMVRAGEASGNLDTILLKLTTYIEKSAKIKAQVKSAMFYPMMIVTVAVSVISVLLIWVVPTFAKQYTDAGKELPGLTQFVLDLSQMMINQAPAIFGSLFAGIIGLRYYIKTPKGRAWFDNLLLIMPGFGTLFRKLAVGRFCNTMSTMLNSGVNLLEALTICASSSGNMTIEKFVLNVRGSIEQGSKFSEPLAAGGLFPKMVVSMVAVGEATGALDEMLVKVSEFYEDEVDIAVKTLLSMIEPVMIAVIGGIVGVIVIAMYLPVFDMASVAGG